jgi:hypothetical protein
VHVDMLSSSFKEGMFIVIPGAGYELLSFVFVGGRRQIAGSSSHISIIS